MTKTVIILGASYTGVGIAHSLLKRTQKEVTDLKVVLVSTTTHMYWNLASVRAIVPGQLSDDKIFQDIQSGFKQYPSGSFEFVHGRATGINPDANTVTISTESGESTKDYDHLVISTGSRTVGDVPWKASLEGYEKTKSLLHEYQNKVKEAKSIVIAGAGPTGVETSGEIAFEFGKGKEVTLITSGKSVLADLPASVVKVATNELQNLGVKIVAETKVQGSVTKPDGKTELTLSTGEKLVTDLYLPTVGVIPNTEYVPSKLLNDHGDVVVDEYLHAKNTSNIWAAGDVVDIQPSQMKYATDQSKALSKNLDLVLKGKAPEIYKFDGAPIIAVTIGRSKATGRSGNMKLPSLLIWWIKGRTLFTEKLPKYISGAEF
ncbi:FAD protein [Venustampulla echinocandica]|uniref:FAD protein n=1 Tax=Venustampulla echinocandica TaxID=2656787 RepID=A0A370TJT9_9HELO|nr:FAD protein [Venustampulla echinocandica]RDL35791.1 FAD protein [Venustampulla echinocandica]